MAKNSISLKGNLTRDPFFDHLDGRDGPVPFMRFTLAVDRHPPRQAGTDYLQVLAYKQRALHDHASSWPKHHPATDRLAGLDGPDGLSMWKDQSANG